MTTTASEPTAGEPTTNGAASNGSQPEGPFDELMSFAQERGYKLDWLRKAEIWGSGEESDLSRGGLLLQDLAGSDPAEVPDESDNLTGRPRGTQPRKVAPRVGNYRVRTKSDIWLRNAAELYEEAVQRQWSSATDIPWHTLTELPDDIEAAECKLATFLTEIEFVAGDVPGRWISEITPEYFEPRMFLISQVVDEARHLDVFRKRALANGGGLMERNPRAGSDVFAGTIDSARDFTEMSAKLHISGEGSVLTIFRMGERMAYNDAEKMIYRLAASDEARHVAFGVMHLQYLGQTMPERREEIHSYLDEAERGLITGTNQNPAANANPSNAALAILLGGGKDKIEEGQKLALAMRQRQVKEYVQRVTVAGFGERFEEGRSAGEMLRAYASA